MHLLPTTGMMWGDVGGICASRRFSLVVRALAAGGALLASAPADAGTHEREGAALYRLYCASCHGPAADGNGRLAATLTPRPADLRQLAQRYGSPLPKAPLINTVLDPARFRGRICNGRMLDWAHGQRTLGARERGIVLEALRYLESRQAFVR